MPQPSEKLTFGLVHGSWHGAWCWRLLQHELEQAGHDAVAMDLPIDDVTSTFDTYADVVVDALSDRENVVLVGHSRAGNVIPRAAGRLATKNMIFLASSFEAETIGCLSTPGEPIIPPRNTEEYLSGVVATHPGGSLTQYEPEQAKQYFYHDCEPDIQEWAVRQLRPQRFPRQEPRLEEWPNVPQDYVVCANDRIISSKWTSFVTENRLKVKPVEIQSGHSPFLSVPHKLARLVLHLSKKESFQE